MQATCHHGSMSQHEFDNAGRPHRPSHQDFEMVTRRSLESFEVLRGLEEALRPAGEDRQLAVDCAWTHGVATSSGTPSSWSRCHRRVSSWTPATGIRAIRIPGCRRRRAPRSPPATPTRRCWRPSATWWMRTWPALRGSRAGRRASVPATRRTRSSPRRRPWDCGCPRTCARCTGSSMTTWASTACSARPSCSRWRPSWSGIRTASPEPASLPMSCSSNRSCSRRTRPAGCGGCPAATGGSRSPPTAPAPCSRSTSTRLRTARPDSSSSTGETSSGRSATWQTPSRPCSGRW